MAIQQGLCQTWLETPKTGFLTMWLMKALTQGNLSLGFRPSYLIQSREVKQGADQTAQNECAG